MGKYLSICGECTESIEAYTDNTRKVLYYGEYVKFTVVCGTQNCLQIGGKYLNVFVEC